MISLTYYLNSIDEKQQNINCRTTLSQQYCNRDIFNQNTLSYSHQHNLYTNARNRRKVQLQTRHPTFFKKQTTQQSESSRTPIKVEKQPVKQKLVKSNKSDILNVSPAIIHLTGSNRMSFMLSQRAKTQMRQGSRNKLQRCKTVNFDWNSEGSSIAFSDVNSPHYGYRPRTAGQIAAAGLNKIKVYLPCRPHSSKFKQDAINPWDSYEDECT